MTLTIEKTGRRYYIVGNTYAIKDQLRDAGCKWDGERKAWWTSKRDIADKFSGDVAEPVKTQALDTMVSGRATYQGKTYYVVWSGYTRSGEYAVKLCFRDGTKEFWAKDTSAVAVTATYRERRTIRSLREYAEQAKRHDPDGIGRSLPDGYYMRNGEVLASGCGECSRLGHMCRQCQHDYE